MTTTSEITAPRSRRTFDGWRWGGRVFLLFMLLYTAVPMIWMLITSIKSGFAAMQFPPQWWPSQPTLASYQKLLDPQVTAARLAHVDGDLVILAAQHLGEERESADGHVGRVGGHATRLGLVRDGRDQALLGHPLPDAVGGHHEPNQNQQYDPQRHPPPAAATGHPHRLLLHECHSAGPFQAHRGPARGGLLPKLCPNQFRMMPTT